MIEDLTTYTEVTPNGSILTITDPKVIYTNSDRDITTYLYKDKGAAHFDGDLEHLLEVEITSQVLGSWTILWAITNELDGVRSLQQAGKSFIGVDFYGLGGTTGYIRIYESDGGAEYRCANLTINEDTLYYLKVVRDENVGTYGTAYLYVYSDAARENLVTSGSVALHSSKKDFRYIYAFSSYNTASSGTDQSGYVQDLDIGEVSISVSDTLALSEDAKEDIGTKVSDSLLLSEVISLIRSRIISVTDTINISDKLLQLWRKLAKHVATYTHLSKSEADPTYTQESKHTSLWDYLTKHR